MRTYTLIIYRSHYEISRGCGDYDSFPAFFEKTDGLDLEGIAQHIAQYKADPDTATAPSYIDEEIHWFAVDEDENEDEFDRDERISAERSSIMKSADSKLGEIHVERARQAEIDRQAAAVAKAEQAAKSAAAAEAAERAMLAKLQAKYRQ